MTNSVSDSARQRLAELLRATLQSGEITLASGRTTDFYIDGRLVTLDPVGLQLVSELVVASLPAGCTAVGGPTSGADPMVAGAGLEAQRRGQNLKMFFVRGQAKAHGMQRRIEGPAITAADQVVIVDDVATSGGSLIKAIDAVRAETDAKVLQALVIVDREEGAGQALQEAGIELVSLFSRTELLGR